MDDPSLISPTAAAVGYEWGVFETSRPPSTEKDGYLNRNNASVNAVSFGFVATAVLISMFLVMAIFERFLRPRSSLSPVSPLRNGEAVVNEGAQIKRNAATTIDYVTGVSVLMPGQDTPTFIAKPVPILCPHEGISWPTHTESSNFDSSPTPATLEKAQDESFLTIVDLNGSSSVAAPASNSS